MLNREELKAWRNDAFAGVCVVIFIIICGVLGSIIAEEIPKWL